MTRALAALAVAAMLVTAGAQAFDAQPAKAGAAPAGGGPAGTISTVAGGIGGPAPTSDLAYGQQCANTFHDGFLYMSGQVIGSNSFLGTSNYLDDAIRRVSLRTGQLTNLAGSDSNGFTPDGARALGGPVGAVCGLAVDQAGNLVFSDGDAFDTAAIGLSVGNNRIRVLAARTGTFYGQAMAQGRVYTIAGTGAFGFSGDGGPATEATIDGPSGLSIDTSGNVIFADAGNNRIRVIAEARRYV